MTEFVHLVRTYAQYVFGGIGYTLLLTAGSMAGSLTLGLVLALARVSQKRFLSSLARMYIDFIRGTPILLHLFLVYFGLPALHILISPMSAIIVAFSLNGAAFMAEIYRAGIIAVAGEQMDGALALGMSYAQAMRLIILPQIVHVILPPTTNFLISTLKDTSLALVIAVPEIMYRAYNAISYTFQGMSLLVIAAAAYLALTLPLSRLVSIFEGRIHRLQA